MLSALARLLSRQGRRQEALAAFVAISEADPSNAKAKGRAGALLEDLGRLSAAVSLHDEAVALDPSDAELWYLRARALRSAARPLDALASAGRCVALAPPGAQAAVPDTPSGCDCGILRGMPTELLVLAAAEGAAGGAAALEELLREQEGLVPQLAGSSFFQRRAAEALAAAAPGCRQARQRAASAGEHARKGFYEAKAALLAAGDGARRLAGEVFRVARRWYAEVLLLQGRMLLDAAEAEAAKDVLERAMQDANCRDAVLFRMMAEAETRLGDPEAAIILLQAAIDGGEGDHAPTLVQIGEAYQDLELYEDALEHFLKAEAAAAEPEDRRVALGCALRLLAGAPSLGGDEFAAPPTAEVVAGIGRRAVDACEGDADRADAAVQTGELLLRLQAERGEVALTEMARGWLLEAKRIDPENRAAQQALMLCSYQERQASYSSTDAP